MQHLDVSCALRTIQWPFGVKWLKPRATLICHDVCIPQVYSKVALLCIIKCRVSMQQISLCQPSVTRPQAREQDVLPEQELPCGAEVRDVTSRSQLFSVVTGQISYPGNMNTIHRNILCSDHRRHACRSTDTMAKTMVSQAQHVYQHCLFRSCEHYLPQNRVNCVRLCKFYRHGHFTNNPSLSCKQPGAYECLQAIVSAKTAWTNFRTTSLPNKNRYVLNSNLWTKVAEHVFVCRASELQYRHQPLAMGRPNPSSQQILP